LGRIAIFSVDDVEPADDKVVNLNPTKPRPTNANVPNRDGSDGERSDRQGPDAQGAEGRDADPKRAESGAWRPTRPRGSLRWKHFVTHWKAPHLARETAFASPA